MVRPTGFHFLTPPVRNHHAKHASFANIFSRKFVQSSAYISISALKICTGGVWLKHLHWEKWVCYIVGYVFIISGMMKLIMGDFLATFVSIGMPYPEVTIFILAIIEISCGAFVISRLYVRQATIPLIVVMIGAILLTKVPILLNDGILSFLFHARLDFVMFILLILLWQRSPGKKHA